MGGVRGWPGLRGSLAPALHPSAHLLAGPRKDPPQPCPPAVALPPEKAEGREGTGQLSSSGDGDRASGHEGPRGLGRKPLDLSVGLSPPPPRPHVPLCPRDPIHPRDSSDPCDSLRPTCPPPSCPPLSRVSPSVPHAHLCAPQALQCDVSVEEDNRQEWTFTLYGFDHSGKATREVL